MFGDQEVVGDVPRESAYANPPDEAAIELALEAVRAADHADLCAGVLEVTAVLSADGVRRELLHAAGQTGVLVRGRRVAVGEVDQALAELADRSLLIVSSDRQSVIMPGAVAQVVRSRASPADHGVLGRRVDAGSAGQRTGQVAGPGRG